MDSSELISVQKYAAKNRLSIHTIIKKTMSGELPTVIKEENGKEVTYIVMNESPSQPQPEQQSNSDQYDIDYKKAYEDLNKEYLTLKTKYERLLASTQGES